MHPFLKSKGYKPRRGKVKDCSGCGIEIYVTPRLMNRKNNFCSTSCWMEWKKRNAFSFNCCICGKEVKTQPAQIKYRFRKTCSRKCRGLLMRKRAEERRKEYTKHQLDRLARYSKEAKEWRKAVFKRDDWTCQICGIRGSYLEADHIKPFAYFPELRYELDNGRTLCKKCHNKTKIGYKKMRQQYAQELNKSV